MRDFEGLTRLALRRLMTKSAKKIPPSSKSALGDYSGTAFILMQLPWNVVRLEIQPSRGCCVIDLPHGSVVVELPTLREHSAIEGKKPPFQSLP